MFISDVRTDITSIRKQNPRLRVVVSLGGEAVKGSLFSSLITNNDSFNNLTSSISNYHKDEVIDGLEIDWEWPVRDGGKKDRMKLIRYARVSNYTPNVDTKFSLQNVFKCTIHKIHLQNL